MFNRSASGEPIPDALRASVLLRLERLDRRDRRLLLCASVIGRRFAVDLLCAMLDLPRVRVVPVLQHGCALQLLEDEDGCGRYFLFRHAVTRDVAYGELLATRTRPLHRRIARAMESGGRGSVADIAYHWWAAGDRRRGVRSNERAGDEAAAMHAYGLALTHYRRALALAEPDTPAYDRLAANVRRLETA